MGISPLSFVGISKFSEDFQTILTRAVSIAQLPVKQLQNRDLDAIQKKSLLTGLSSGVAGLASSLKALGETSENRALTASSSNSSAVTALNSGAATAATYVIDEVTSVATAASERTLIGYADSAATAVGTTGDFKLVVGDDEYDFTPANNTLVGLRDHINGLGAGVTASILTTADGNFLSISASGTGQTTLELRNDPTGVNTNLLTATNQGANAEFKLNGIDVSQSTNLVNSVIPGLTFTIVAETATPVTLTLASNRSTLSSALQSFVAQYNAARDLVNAQVGPAAGLLSGNTLVNQIQGQLRGIASYRTTSGEVTGLAELGIEFDTAGKATFNAEVYNALTEARFNAAFDFIGDATTGLAEFSDSLTEFSDPIGGLIQLEQEGLDRVDKRLQEQIEEMNTRINVMQKGLALKLQMADTLLASLESQQNLLTASLDSLNSVLYGRQDD